jgi:hypothetical protein
MPTDNSKTTKFYSLAAYDGDGKLLAAEFVEGLPVKVLDAVECWTDGGGEFRIKRIMEIIDAGR